MMVYVASDPMKLYFFHTKTNVIESMDLSFIPTCISISPDQDYAVVGHDAHISYIDLNSKSVIRTYNVSCNVFDIVFGDNNWAYAFPKNDYGSKMRCVNLNLPNDNETSGGDYSYEKTRGRLYPKGKYIYTTRSGYLEKLNIQNGTAEFLYNSWNTDVDGDFWFSEDGNRIFGRSKNVYLTSESQNQDMKYNGTIVIPDDQYYSTTIQWVEHSANKTNLYIIVSFPDWWGAVPSSFMYIYNASNLVFKNKIPLEKYHVGNNQSDMKEYDAIPYFIFSNSDGDEVVVVTKANGSGLEHEWAIKKITIND
jgi:hypothetical protein